MPNRNKTSSRVRCPLISGLRAWARRGLSLTHFVGSLRHSDTSSVGLKPTRHGRRSTRLDPDGRLGRIGRLVNSFRYCLTDPHQLAIMCLQLLVARGRHDFRQWNGAPIITLPGGAVATWALTARPLAARSG